MRTTSVLMVILHITLTIIQVPVPALHISKSHSLNPHHPTSPHITPHHPTSPHITQHHLTSPHIIPEHPTLLHNNVRVLMMNNIQRLTLSSHITLHHPTASISPNSTHHILQTLSPFPESLLGPLDASQLSGVIMEIELLRAVSICTCNSMISLTSVVGAGYKIILSFHNYY